MLPMGLRQIGAGVVFCLGGGLATPLPFYSSLEGSTDEEDLSNSASSLPTTYLFSEHQTTPASPTHVQSDFLGQVVSFLEENMLLVLVTTCFVLLVSFIVCGAIFMSRRRKVNAYYPSSFPSKMYVDHRDKTGGAKPFNDVPEKPAPEQESEPVDSHRQLQADIMRAAKMLRTPNKSVDAAEGSGGSQKAADHSPGNSSETCGGGGGVPDQQLPSFPEEKESCELLHIEEAAEAAGGGDSAELSNPPEQQHPEVEDPEKPHPEEDNPEQTPPDEDDPDQTPPVEDDPEQTPPVEDDPEQTPPEEDDDSREPLTGRSLRPSSLHIHNDSATLQLIAGEKTAF